jgi:hypothetical protein
MSTTLTCPQSKLDVYMRTGGTSTTSALPTLHVVTHELDIRQVVKKNFLFLISDIIAQQCSRLRNLKLSSVTVTYFCPQDVRKLYVVC